MSFWRRLFAVRKVTVGRDAGEDWSTVRALFEAMQTGDLAGAEHLLSENEKRNARVLRSWIPVAGRDSRTLLHEGASGGHVDFARLFLMKGADQDMRDRLCGETALHVAAFHGQVAIVELLLSAGADVNAKDSSGQTPLHRIVGHANGTMTELLVSHGADLNAQDGSGDTPLHLAAESFRPMVVQVLLAKGADACRRNGLGKTPLETATSTWENMRPYIEATPPQDPYYKGALRVLEWGPQVLVLLRQGNQEASLPRSSLSFLALRCSSCEVCYNIGDDALLVTLDQAAALLDATVRFQSAEPLQDTKRDLVSFIDGSPLERRHDLLMQARETAQLVVESLHQGQRRVWICHHCKHPNGYPPGT